MKCFIGQVSKTKSCCRDDVKDNTHPMEQECEQGGKKTLKRKKIGEDLRFMFRKHAAHLCDRL